MESAPAPVRIKASKKHQRQAFWQITFPVLLAAVGCIVLIIFIVLAAAGGSGGVSKWANISTVWLVIPLLGMGFVFVIPIVGLIFLLTRIRRNLPTYTHLIHVYLQIFNLRLETILHQAVRPQIAVLSRWSGWTTFWERLLHFGDHKRF